jgi:group I intron endonuclease
MGNDCYIYLTTNLINGKKYIGSRDKTLTKGHGVYLGSGVNLKLAIKKYGRQNFKKEILEECSKEERYNLENYYINKYNAIKNPNFYNLEGARGTFSGYTHNQSTKNKIYTLERNRKISESNSKPILQYTTEGIFIKEWKSAMEAWKYNPKFDYANITNCCKGKLKTSAKHIWKYK